MTLFSISSSFAAVLIFLRVKCGNNLSSLHASSCGMCSPVLCFRSSTFHHVHYPVSTLIASLSINHHLYADDPQLSYSFHPPNFDLSITHVLCSSTALFLDDCKCFDVQLLQDWMCAHRRLKKTTCHIHISSLNTTHSARNLGVIFDEHLTFSDQISSVSKSWLSFSLTSL